MTQDFQYAPPPQSFGPSVIAGPKETIIINYNRLLAAQTKKETWSNSTDVRPAGRLFAGSDGFAVVAVDIAHVFQRFRSTVVSTGVSGGEMASLSKSVKRARMASYSDTGSASIFSRIEIARR